MSSSVNLPPVTCAMSTYNRRAYIAWAIRCFLWQDYPNKELVILDDGSDPVGDLIPLDERVRYVRLEHRLPLGAKRNRACELAQGEIIANWDDDDWHAPHRLSSQVGALLGSGADLVGLSSVLFYDLGRVQGWQYVYTPRPHGWLHGGSLVYRREAWRRRRFPTKKRGADARFVMERRSDRVHVLPDFTIYVALIHDTNNSPKLISGSNWRPYPLEEIRRLVGPDWPH